MSSDASPRFSVVIPTFGRPLSLERAIASALADIGADDEVIVVDDGSTPPIALSEGLNADKRLCLIRADQNRGAAAARNLGIARARGEWIAFLDSDDRWLPGKTEAQRALLAQRPYGELLAVSCGWSDVRGGQPLRVRIPRPSRRREDFFAGNWFAPGATLLIAKTAFDLCGPFREDLPRLEDYEWFIRFALAGGRLVTSDVIGAEIAVGANARSGPVNDAAAKIAALYAGDPRLRAIERRKMAAFLALVRAVGARNDGLWAPLAFHLANSFFQAPRLSLQLDDWWPKSAVYSRR